MSTADARAAPAEVGEMTPLTAEPKPQSEKVRQAAIILTPFTVFFFVSLSIIFFYPSASFFVISFNLFVLLAIVLLRMYSSASQKYGLQPFWPYQRLSALSFCAFCVAVMISVYACLHYTEAAFQYESRRVYRNVSPTQKPTAFVDASIIEFSASTFVNRGQAVGFKNHDVYCVAPVQDHNGGEVNFFAAGKNCCQSRVAITCDAVGDDAARTGMVMLADTWPASLDHELFEEAAKMAAADYGFEVAERPIFVTWVNDADTVIDGFHSRAVTYFVVWNLVYGIICCIVAYALSGRVHDDLKRLRRK
mmetsp:Transcript_16490/g.36429  ORF Transcript_16490/g.36429 Transcript_16490/m.36429 type:complete len:306 (+) Transcript_16490:96-1013(+)|eukprot:CAMPEP_0204275312 /NCGR_PEP_ID=MMETSP0468-20130131/25746_1 /ASSEMBLY_ACC=CAM_ASM_000383 /TAXON_ID=2969 /ORGANISM="Oxyrrhis marina" /LENGTH=305 /DNA_ID=CAMNT_0051251633 /DNA_START=60 /DNA_END=977 /DNA_ORIENTATION=-